MLSDIVTVAEYPIIFTLCQQRSYLNHCIYFEKKILIGELWWEPSCWQSIKIITSCTLMEEQLKFFLYLYFNVFTRRLAVVSRRAEFNCSNRVTQNTKSSVCTLLELRLQLPLTWTGPEFQLLFLILLIFFNGYKLVTSDISWHRGSFLVKM